MVFRKVHLLMIGKYRFLRASPRPSGAPFAKVLEDLNRDFGLY